MGVSKTQVVKFIRKGTAGENGISVSLLPASLTAKVGVVTKLVIQVALYDGGRLIPYADPNDGNMLCSTLSTEFSWSFKVDNGKFYYWILVNPATTDIINIPITVTYKNTNYANVITIQPVADGDKGDKGDQGDRGPTLRGPQAWSDCATGYAFQAGGAGDKWQDVVIYGDNYYSCVKSHTKTASNYPGSTTAINNGYWQLGDKIELVATKILLATYALVKNLGVEAIDMKDANGNILFQAKDGVVTCKTGTFNDVVVQSGKIAGFTISGNGLSNTPFDNDAYIIFRNDGQNTFAGIGGNVLPASSGAKAVARFENHDENDLWGLGTNYGLLVSARGARDNRAIQIDGGAVSGFALRNAIISETTTSKTLSRYDCNVIAINENSCTLTLPTMQLYDDGHVIRIKRLGSGELKLKMGYCYTYNGTSSRYSIPVLIYDRNSKLTGTNTLTFSSVCDAMELVWVRDIIYTIDNVTYYGAWVQYKLPRDW